MLLDVHVLSPGKVFYKGAAKSVVLPGEEGVFEILPFHKPILSRLISGVVYVDEKEIAVRRGIVQCLLNKVTVIIEEMRS